MMRLLKSIRNRFYSFSAFLGFIIGQSVQPHRKGARISTLIHGGLLIIIIFSFGVRGCSQPKQDHVFTLEDVTSVQEKENKPVSLQKQEKIKPLPLQKKQEKPIVKEVKKNQELTKKLSYDEFVKKQGKPITKEKPVQQPKINIQKIESQLKAASITNTSATSADAMTAYILGIKKHIDGVWRKPTQISLIGLEATVEFTVYSDGLISGARIIKSSGNKAFDDSILEAMALAKCFLPPPGNKQHVFQLNIKNVD